MDHNPFISYLSNSSLGTCFKGAIGTAPPVFALTFHIDAWAAPIQAAFGVAVPMFTLASLYYDLKRKRRINRENDRLDAIRDQRRLYFLRKHKLKQKRSLSRQNKSDNI